MSHSGDHVFIWIHLFNGSTNYSILEYIFCLERHFDVVLTTPKKNSIVRSMQCLARLVDVLLRSFWTFLLYGTEACLNKNELRSLNFTVTRVLMKLFHTYSPQIIEELQEYFNFSSCECLIKKRKFIFLRKYCALNNTKALCVLRLLRMLSATWQHLTRDFVCLL